HRRRDERRVGQERPSRLARDAVHDRGQLQAEQREQQRVEEEDEDLPVGVGLDARRRVDELRRAPAEVDAARDRGEHGAHARRLGPSRDAISVAATGSVGATSAPRTKASGQSRPTATWATTATVTVVSVTRPTASSVIGCRLSRSPRSEEKNAAEYSSGGSTT